MKNQYFGDINDYRKYGLIRAIHSAGGLRTLVAWMLTNDDGRTDGQTIGYLDQPDRWESFDPDLFNALRAALRRNPRRHVGLIELTDILPNAAYYSDIVQDAAHERAEWFKTLAMRVQSSDLVFLDPDNGLEVKSRPLWPQEFFQASILERSQSPLGFRSIAAGLPAFSPCEPDQLHPAPD